jgi:hypothetical protein
MIAAFSAASKLTIIGIPSFSRPSCEGFGKTFSNYTLVILCCKEIGKIRSISYALQYSPIPKYLLIKQAFSKFLQKKNRAATAFCHGADHLLQYGQPVLYSAVIGRTLPA